jgi:deazaflavin-dependent oxidoreductase (nitroreductase family)
MADQAAITAALHRGGLVDITTTGRRSRQPRRIEVGFFDIDGRIYVSGAPGRRGWLANLAADPRLTFHLKRGVTADLPATARIIRDEVERRAVLERICARWRALDRLEVFVARAPLIEVIPNDPTLLQA